MSDKLKNIKPVRCEKCKSDAFNRVVGYSDNGEFIEEWYSDEVVKCAKCGHPLHRNKFILDNKERVRIPVLTEYIQEIIEEERAKKENRQPDYKKKSWEWFAGRFKLRK